MGYKISENLIKEYGFKSIYEYAEPKDQFIGYLSMRDEIYPMLRKIDKKSAEEPSIQEHNALINKLQEFKTHVGMIQALNSDFPKVQPNDYIITENLLERYQQKA